eukprot:156390_1
MTSGWGAWGGIPAKEDPNNGILDGSIPNDEGHFTIFALDSKSILLALLILLAISCSLNLYQQYRLYHERQSQKRCESVELFLDFLLALYGVYTLYKEVIMVSRYIFDKLSFIMIISFPLVLNGFLTSETETDALLGMDVVIPVAGKDYIKLEHTIHYLLKYSSANINKIWIISKQNITVRTNTTKDWKIKWIDENTMYPFKLSDIQQLLSHRGSKLDHATWHFQQLLKLYIFQLDALDVLDNVLILDSDFIVMKHIEFIDKNGKGILANGYPIWSDFTECGTKCGNTMLDKPDYWLTKLIPNLTVSKHDIDNDQIIYSGILHHMLLKRNVMKRLFDVVERYHQCPFWQAFINSVKVSVWNDISEYSLYYHYVLSDESSKKQYIFRHMNHTDILIDINHPSYQDLLEQFYKSTAFVGNNTMQSKGFHSMRYKERFLANDHHSMRLLHKTFGYMHSESYAWKYVLRDGNLSVSEAISMSQGNE